MTNKPIIPIFRAKVESLEEDIAGMPIKIFWYGNETAMMIPDGEIFGGNMEPTYDNQIKPETLRISLDGGTTFRTLEEVNKLIEYGEKYEDML